MDPATLLDRLHEALPEGPGAATPAPYRMGLRRARALPDDPPLARLRGTLLERHPARLGSLDHPAVAQAVARLGGLGAARDVLARGPDDVFVTDRGGRVVAHAIALPSGYAPEQTLGRPAHALHGVAPGLHAALPGIEAFLRALPDGEAYERTNLGLAPRGALDRHPATAAPITPPLDGLDVRFELQRFEGLPDGVCFRIRVAHLPVDALPTASRARLDAYLAALPAEVAAYKGLASLRTNGGSSS